MRGSGAALLPAADGVPVGSELGADELTGSRAVLHRAQSHGNDVTGLEGRAAPALARQRVRAAALEAPFGRLIPDHDLQPDMRIRPLQRLDRAAELDDFRVV